MSNISLEYLPKNSVKLTFTITQEEALPYLEEAAKRISQHSPIPGFRPGHANYEIVKQRVGAMKILEEALESIVRKSYIEAMLAKNLETVGSPKIDVEKLAPDNDIVFSATVLRMPEVTQLADFRALSIHARAPEVETREIDLALKDLTRMQTKEIRAPLGQSVSAQDKVVVSMNIKRDGVPIEGGQSPNHVIYLNEEYYIPGFKDELIGLKEGDEKTFSLAFPEEHALKQLAGKISEFEIVLKEIYQLEFPELNDAFAQALGMQNFETLREEIQKNLLAEKQQEARTAEEKEMLELLAQKSQIDEIPDLLLNEELNKMIAELQRGVESHGLEFNSYLTNLKKTLAELKLDLTAQALTRIKVALVLRAVAKQESVEVNESQLNDEIDRLAAQYEEKPMKEKIYSPEYREYMEQMLRNQNAIKFLRELMIK